MSKLSNTLNMLRILEDNKIHSIKSLSETLEVSERMIRQYKQELEQVGIYLKSYTGIYGGYQLEQNTPLIISTIKEEKYSIMNKAIHNSQKVKIKYKSVNSGLTKRIIHPTELFLYLDKWYIAAYCELRGEIRLFKLDNIIEYQVLNDTYSAL